MAVVETFSFSIPLRDYPHDGYVDVVLYGIKYSQCFQVSECTLSYHPDPCYTPHIDEAYPYTCTLAFGSDYTLSWSGLDSRPKDRIWSIPQTASWMSSAQFPYGTEIRCYFGTISMGQTETETQSSIVS